jgi:predicted ATPase
MRDASAEIRGWGKWFGPEDGVLVKRYILTGTPGSGKTSMIKALQERGYRVVDEAATDVIAQEQKLGNMEPWKHPSFVDHITSVQKKRQLETSSLGVELQFYDRSPICTYALAQYLDFTPSAILLDEIERIKSQNIYESQVFFMENLGFCELTGARKISFEESLEFEQVHLDAYAQWRYECIKIAPTSIEHRVEEIIKWVGVVNINTASNSPGDHSRALRLAYKHT